MADLGRRWGGVGESGKSAVRKRRHGDTNCKHEVIQDHMKKSGLITLGVITFGITVNA